MPVNGLRERIKNSPLVPFLKKDLYIDDLTKAALKGLKESTQYHEVFSKRNSVSERDTPSMLSDAVISSAVGLLMETAFQPNPQQGLFRTFSRYEKITELLDKWHEQIGAEDFILTSGFNITVYGNLPCQLLYGSKGELAHVSFEPDYTAVTPIIIYNTCLGYLYDGNYYEPFEFVYGQLKYYKDLGGTRSRNWLWNSNAEGVNNEFMYAPSYLSAAYKPYKSIKIIEDALLLMRLDQSNFRRLLKVNVGENVLAKNASKLYSFYRALLKKARKVTFDSDGVMSAQGIGTDFELIIPKSNRQDVEVMDIKSDTDVKALKDLEQQYRRLFASLKVSPSQIGFAEDGGGGSNALSPESPATVWEKRFARTAKTLVKSTADMLKQIDYYYLRSRGYDVKKEDWNYNFTSVSTLEDIEKQNSLKKGLEVFKEVAASLTEAKVPFNSKYLAEQYLSELLSNSNIDTKKLFDVVEGLVEIEEVEASLLRSRDQDSYMSICSEVGILSEDEVMSLKTPINSLTDVEDGKIKIESSKLGPRRVSYADFQQQPEVLAHTETDVRLPVYVDSVVSSQDYILSKDNQKLPELSTANVYADHEFMSADVLIQGSIAPLDRVYLVPGKGIRLLESDLANFLFMRDIGIKEIIVNEVYIPLNQKTE